MKKCIGVLIIAVLAYGSESASATQYSILVCTPSGCLTNKSGDDRAACIAATDKQRLEVDGPTDPSHYPSGYPITVDCVSPNYDGNGDWHTER